ncbi:MAG: hypothetical protein U0694_07960 [Anaerolineae bacterium]
MPILFSRSLFSIVLLLILMMAAACSPSPQATATVESTLAAEVTEQATEAAAESATEAAEAATEESSEATEAPTEEAAATESATETAAVEATCTLLNLNTVTEDQLLSTMPNFSNRMVREFFEYRTYVSIQQFRREIGKYVDDAQVAEWEQYVYVPVTPNDSDAETLMQLPGVDETIASALTSGRPYANNDAFMTALAAQVSAEDAAQASCYLASE